MRAIWKGAVSFGLVSVPVKLYSATESKDISFRQVHAKDGGRIKYQRTCSLDGEEVEYADIAKGYETEDGEMVILTDEDMEQLPANSSREISVEKFVPSDQIDPMLFEKSYYLEPEKSGAKPYALLREALEAADRMALVTVSLRNRTSLAVLRVRDDVIVMQTMMWPDEIREADFASTDTAEAKPAEVKMAKMLVETLAGDFDPSEFEDDYREAVEAMVKAKIEGGEVKSTPAAKKSSGEVVDLLAALQRSVDAAKTARGEAPKDSGDSSDSGDSGATRGDDSGSGPRRRSRAARSRRPRSRPRRPRRRPPPRSRPRRPARSASAQERQRRRTATRWSSSERSAPVVEQRAKRAVDETRPRSSLGSRPVAADVEGAVVVAQELVAVRARPQERPGFQHRVGPGRMGFQPMVSSAQGRDVVAAGGAALGVGDDVVGIHLPG